MATTSKYINTTDTIQKVIDGEGYFVVNFSCFYNDDGSDNLMPCEPGNQYISAEGRSLYVKAGLAGVNVVITQV